MILFTSERPDFYLISQIYDPLTNPTGQVIPRPGSLVIDPNNQHLLRTVISVDENTREVTYGPVTTALMPPPVVDQDPSDQNIMSVIDYGNSRFYLFYDKAESPTKLNIDKKVIILGDDAESYEIVKHNQELDRYIPVSLYFDSDGTFLGTRIPLSEISTEHKAKVPTNCHTSFDINDDEVYYMFVYDYAGTQCGSVKLYAKRAIINNVNADTLLITDFVLEATQINQNGLYLYPDQDPESLVISPYVVYSNGQRRLIPIDNQICHLYGLEGFTAAYPGQEIELIVKYFLAPTQQAIGNSLVTSGSTRYLMKTIKLVVQDPGDNEYDVKISVIPKYLPTLYKYTLLFYLYTLGDNQVRNITPFVTVSPAFDGRLMGVNQELIMNFRIRDVFPDAATDFHYQQPVVVKLAPNDYYERYVLRDTLSDNYGVYGVDSPITPRPVIYFDQAINKYFIPTSKFASLNIFLESFYYKARPLFDNSWVPTPPEPTHFTIRDIATGALLLSAPIPVTGYEQEFGLVGVIDANHLLGINCIVEFLKYHQGQYTVLYGVPVDVHPGINA